MFLGVEIGGTKLQIVAGDGPGTIARRWRGTVRPGLGGAGICDQIKSAIADWTAGPGGMRIKAAGIGFGGPIDTASGRVRRSHQIDGWENFPLRDWLAELVQAPVAVDNDANVAALGEAVRGAGAGADPVFYVTLGSGVGGGLVAGGNVYHGAAPGEAEFGHLRLDRDGSTVESRCSGWAVDGRIRRLAAEEPQSPLARAIGDKPGGEARHLAAALRQGDAAATSILRELAGDLSFALSHAVHLFHPQVIVLGGGLSLVGGPLRAAVAGALPAFTMHAFLPAPDVRLAGLGEDSVPVGALELAARLAVG
ncbi:MAG TPA: ROK family protein [Tepidisphaeraceae bacterium]|jgi:glucokinase|nr:ROK family protein [Tepidisphaeraceae bacterium]